MVFQDQWDVFFATLEICSIHWMFACQFWMIVCKYWMFDQEYILWFSGVAVFFARILQALESRSYCQASRMPRNRASSGTYLDHPASWDGPFFCSNTFWPDLCPDGHRRFFPGKKPLENAALEFSLENAQSGKCQQWCNYAPLGKKTARAACFPRTRIDLRFSDCAHMVNHEHPW